VKFDRRFVRFVADLLDETKRGTRLQNKSDFFVAEAQKMRDFVVFRFGGLTSPTIVIPSKSRDCIAAAAALKLSFAAVNEN
jgi:proline racemase